MNIYYVDIQHDKIYLSESHYDVIKTDVDKNFYQIATKLFQHKQKLKLQYPLKKLIELNEKEQLANKSIKICTIQTQDLLNVKKDDTFGSNMNKRNSSSARKSFQSVFQKMAFIKKSSQEQNQIIQQKDQVNQLNIMTKVRRFSVNLQKNKKETPLKKQQSKIGITSEKHSNIDSYFEMLHLLRVEDEKSVQQQNKQTQSFNQEWMYLKLKVSDLSSMKVLQFCWSGRDVLQSQQQSLSQLISVLSSVSLRHSVPWTQDVFGLVRLLQYHLLIIIECPLYKLVVAITSYLFLLLLPFVLEQTSCVDTFNALFAFLFSLYLGISCITTPLKVSQLLDVIVITCLVLSIYIPSSSYLICLSLLKGVTLMTNMDFSLVVHSVLYSTFWVLMYVSLIMFTFIFCASVLATNIFHSYLDTYSFKFISFPLSLATTLDIITLNRWYNLILLAYDTPYALQIIVYVFLIIFLGNVIALNIFIVNILQGFEETTAINQNNVDSVIGKVNTVLSKVIPNFRSLPSTKTKDDKSMESDCIQDTGSLLKSRSSRHILRHMPSVFGQPNMNKYTKRSLNMFRIHNPIRQSVNRVSNSTCYGQVVKTMAVISMGNLFVAQILSLQSQSAVIGQIQTVCHLMTNCWFAFEFVCMVIVQGAISDRECYMRSLQGQTQTIIVGLFVIEIFYIISNDRLVMNEYQQLQQIMVMRAISCFALLIRSKQIRQILANMILTVKGLLDLCWLMVGVWFGFAVMGLFLFRGQFGYCGQNHQDSLDVTFGMCQEQNRVWNNYSINFDTLDQAFLFLFQISTFTDFGEHFQVMMNSGDKAIGPKQGQNMLLACVYMYSFVFVGVYFYMNLFMGTLFSNFIAHQKKAQFLNLSDMQIKWLYLQDEIQKENPLHFLQFQNGHRVLHQHMETIEKLVEYTLIFSVFQMMITSNDSVIQNIKVAIQLLALACQLSEVVLKWYVYGMCQYFRFNKYRVQILLLVMMIIGIMAAKYDQFLQGEYENKQSINISLRLLSLLELMPLLRLPIRLKELDKIIRNIYFSVKLMYNIFVVLIIVLLFYGILGNILFSDLNGEPLNSVLNFRSLLSSVVVLFKILSCDNWANLYLQCLELKIASFPVGKVLAPLYFFSFMIITRIIIINIHQSILITQIEDYFNNSSNIINFYKDNVRRFKVVWNSISYQLLSESAEFIDKNNMILFLKALGPPLCDHNDHIYIVKQIANMKLKSNHKDKVHFRIVLYFIFKHYIYKQQQFKFTNVQQQKELLQKELRIQKRILKVIWINDQKHLQRTGSKNNLLEPDGHPEVYQFNPLMTHLSHYAYFKSWVKFSQIQSQKRGFQKRFMESQSNRIKMQPNKLLLMLGNIGRTITNLFQVNKIYKGYIDPSSFIKKQKQINSERPQIILTQKMKGDIRYNDLIKRQQRRSVDGLQNSSSSEEMDSGINTDEEGSQIDSGKTGHTSLTNSNQNLLGLDNDNFNDVHDKNFFKYAKDKLKQMETIKFLERQVAFNKNNKMNRFIKPFNQNSQNDENLQKDNIIINIKDSATKIQSLKKINDNISEIDSKDYPIDVIFLKKKSDSYEIDSKESANIIQSLNKIALDSNEENEDNQNIFQQTNTVINKQNM